MAVLGSLPCNLSLDCMFEAGAVCCVGGWAVSVFLMPLGHRLVVRSQHLDLFSSHVFSLLHPGPPVGFDGHGSSSFAHPALMSV